MTDSFSLKNGETYRFITIVALVAAAQDDFME